MAAFARSHVHCQIERSWREEAQPDGETVQQHGDEDLAVAAHHRADHHACDVVGIVAVARVLLHDVVLLAAARQRVYGHVGAHVARLHCQHVDVLVRVQFGSFLNKNKNNFKKLKHVDNQL